MSPLRTIAAGLKTNFDSHGWVPGVRIGFALSRVNGPSG